MNPNLVYDVGMSGGEDTAYYLHRGFRVVAVEANPRLAEAARRRFSRHVGSGRLTIVDAAIAEREGVQPFWISETRPGWSSLHRASAARGGPHYAIEVQCVTLATLFERHGVPYYFKADVEGQEPLCIEALALPEPPAYVSVEAGPGVVECLPRLHALGYTSFKCISQFAFVPVELPATSTQRRWERLVDLARSRRLSARAIRRLGARKLIDRQLKAFVHHDDWTFTTGSSGPFGEETRGRWLSIAQVTKIYAEYEARWRRQERSALWRRSGDPGAFWVDFHARHRTARVAKAA